MLPYLELQKDNEKEEEIKKQIEVPNIEGMSITQASKVLKEVNLSLKIQNEPEIYDKEQTMIKTQLPKKGISVYEGTKIIVEI
ncbi:MAG: PASTA domain-containing protein [Clostridia bacterium]|nr:PASTA domain-containing protein [Clostridia bacterium]